MAGEPTASGETIAALGCRFHVSTDEAIEQAKRMLEQAVTPDERAAAVMAAMQAGMPLHHIEAYLDWLDLVRSQGASQETQPPPGNVS